MWFGQSSEQETESIPRWWNMAFEIYIKKGEKLWAAF